MYAFFNAAKGADIGVSFSVLPKRAVDAALNENWSGGNYSERIWGRSDDFVTAVQETVINGLMTGKSMDARAQMLADRLGVEVDYNVRRLIRTETAHFTNQGQLQAYQDAGFTEYRYLAALSSATCEVCADLDGQIFKVADAREGVNLRKNGVFPRPSADFFLEKILIFRDKRLFIRIADALRLSRILRAERAAHVTRLRGNRTRRMREHLRNGTRV